MLVEVGAVEVSEAVGVGREVRRHPVDDHADAALVQSVDHLHQVLGAPVTGGRGEVARRLVAPRAVEGVLHHGQQLDVGEPVRQHVLGERVGELDVVREAVPGRRQAAPRPEVHLVDRHRAVAAAIGHPGRVAPLVVEGADHRCRRGRLVRRRSDRVGLLGPLAVVAGDGVAVGVPDERPGDVPRPDARAPDRFHLLAGPVVEVAEHVDGPGVRCPHSEPRAGGVGMGAEAVVQVAVGALVEEEQIHLSNRIHAHRVVTLRSLRMVSRRRTSVSPSTSDVGRRSRRRHVDGRILPGTLCGAVSPMRSSRSATTR